MISDKVPEFVDATVFLGMHSADDSVRRACKNFFVTRFDGRVAMSFEQIGLCDDFVWQHSREIQDVYYPFMDRLHSVVKFVRQPYAEAEVACALQNTALRDLSMPVRLALAQVIEARGTLYSLHPALASRAGLPVQRPEHGSEKEFPDELEALYRASLRLRLPGEAAR